MPGSIDVVTLVAAGKVEVGLGTSWVEKTEPAVSTSTCSMTEMVWVTSVTAAFVSAGDFRR